MAWHGSIRIGESEGGHVLVLYRGEARVYDLQDAENVAKLRRVASTNHAAGMKFLSRFARVPDAEKAHVQALKSGNAAEFKAILDAIKAATKRTEPPPPAPPPKKGKGK